MNEDDARKVIQPLIEGCTITDVQDYGDIFAIHYVNNGYYLSKNIMDMAIGAGPTFVFKDSGRVIQTGSGRCVEEYVEAYRACGDFFASLGNSVLILESLEGIDTTKLILAFKKMSGYSTSESKKSVNSLQKGESQKLVFGSVSLASDAVLKLGSSGFVAKQEWLDQY